MISVFQKWFQSFFPAAAARMMRVAYRFIIPAALLLVTLVWFNDHLRLLPTKEAVTEYVKQLSVTPDGSSGTLNQTQTVTDSTNSTKTDSINPAKTTTTEAASEATNEVSSPVKDVIDAIIVDSRDKIIVMGALNREDTTWVTDKLPDWRNAIYAVEEGSPISNNPYYAANKGHEASPYLTYIIDHYDTMPSTMAFVHSHEKGWPKAWHTDANGYSNVASLNALNIDYVQRAGYTNLRCISTPGCPNEMQPFRDPPKEEGDAEHAFAEAWRHIFNGTEVPKVVATPCCAQYAVSREQVRQRPREFYVRARQWLLDTELDDPTSGRVFEYMWHIMFGRDAVYCPELNQCYHDVYNKVHKTGFRTKGG